MELDCAAPARGTGLLSPHDLARDDGTRVVGHWARKPCTASRTSKLAGLAGERGESEESGALNVKANMESMMTSDPIDSLVPRAWPPHERLPASIGKQ